MSLYPSNTFKTFEYPTPMQSIFEDFDNLFSDALFHPFHDLQASQRPQKRRSTHHRYFSTAVRLCDFRADEVAVKVEDRKVRVHAKREEGEDIAEVKKTVILPEEVDAEKVETRFTKEGFLVVRAPYVIREKSGGSAGSGTGSEIAEFTDDWQQMRQLLRGPGITDLREHIVKDESGNTRFQIPVPVRDYLPEEISVKQVGDKVVVRAEHKEERDGQLVQRSLHREFKLPQGVDKEQLISRITQQGMLMIEAPAPGLAAPEPKEIPVVELQKADN